MNKEGISGFLFAAAVHAAILAALTLTFIAVAVVEPPQPIPEPMQIDIGEQDLLPPEMSPEEPEPVPFPPEGQEVEEPLEDMNPATRSDYAMLPDPDKPPPEDITRQPQKGLDGEPNREATPNEKKQILQGPRDDGIPKMFGMPIEGNTVFVIDMSGSMGYDLGNSTRLGAVLTETMEAIRVLRPEDSFDIVAFSGFYRYGTLPWRGKLTPASDSAKESAINWLKSLKPDGGTPTLDALVYVCSVYGEEVDNLILVTDGEPNPGTEDTIINNINSWMDNLVDANLVCINVGEDGLPFVKRLVHAAGGAYVEVK